MSETQPLYHFLLFSHLRLLFSFQNPHLPIPHPPSHLQSRQRERREETHVSQFNKSLAPRVEKLVEVRGCCVSLCWAKLKNSVSRVCLSSEIIGYKVWKGSLQNQTDASELGTKENVGAPTMSGSWILTGTAAHGSLGGKCPSEGRSSRSCSELGRRRSEF